MTDGQNETNGTMELDDQTIAQLSEFSSELADDYASYFKVDCLREVWFCLHFFTKTMII